MAAQSEGLNNTSGMIAWLNTYIYFSKNRMMVFEIICRTIFMSNKLDLWYYKFSTI